MLKRSAFFAVGLTLAACSDEPVGGVGYFDVVEPTISVQEPIVLVPVASEEPDMTAALSEAVEAAISEGEIAEPEIEEEPIEDVAPATEPEAEAEVALRLSH